jgi:hypothetical protein
MTTGCDPASFQTDPSWAAKLTSDAEREAMAWLDNLSGAYTHVAILKAMLARASTPPKITEEFVKAVCASMVAGGHLPSFANACEVGTILRWARAEAMKPKTKTAQVWRVEYVEDTDVTPGRTRHWCPMVQNFDTEAGADRHAKNMREHHCYACIRVTGPHEQEVPA